MNFFELKRARNKRLQVEDPLPGAKVSLLMREHGMTGNKKGAEAPFGLR
jgi:hypothetical protein